MKWQQIHKDFRLNGNNFSSIKDLIQYSETLQDKSITLFLTEWFSNKESVIVHTSGSTGKPKPISILKQQMINSAKATAEYLELSNKTTALLALSSEYIAGKMMLVRALVNGWKLDVIEAKSNPLNEINKKYHFTALVPLQVQNSLEQLDKIDKVLIGGGAVSTKLLEDLQKIKSICFASYGMTETVTHIAIKQLNKKNKSSNYHVLPNVKIETDNRGCLVIDAPKVANERVITNDLVKLVSSKEFSWLGRVDNIINSGGIKLIPEQIEEKLSKIISSPFFIDSVKDDVLENKLILIIENQLDKELKNIILNDNTLTKFQKPKEIYFLDNFVYTETKKINRKKTMVKLNLL